MTSSTTDAPRQDVDPGPGATTGSGPLGVVKRAFGMESTSVLVATVALILVIGAIHPDFLDPRQLRDVLQQSVYVAVLAAGVAFLLAMREIDLSVGATFGLTLICSAMLMRDGWSPWVAVIAGILLGALLGLANALIVQVFRIPAIVATLATLSMFRGLSLALSEGQQVVGLPLDHAFFEFFGGRLFGIPVSVLVLVVVGIVLTFVLRTTPFGYRVRSIGSNPDAAAFSGISIARVRIQALMLMGGLAGLAGMLGLAYFGSGDPNIGSGFELLAIAAAVIGGTALRGGSATVVGAMLGAVLLSVVTSGLVYFDIPVNWSSFATGAVILIAVGIDSLLRRRREARAAAAGL
ncbi:ABC transporter permease subunit [Blastococcus saxobsidens]